MRFFSALGWLVAGLLVLAPVSFAAESDVDRLLGLLVEKKVLTQDDAVKFRADLAVKKQEEKEAQKEFNITAGKVIKLSGYIQPRFRQAPGIKDSFDIRRARLALQGDLTERFDYKTQVEFGGTSGPFLLDAAIGYKVNPYIKLTAGQFKIPFSQENLISSPKLETINRSQVVEGLVARGTDVIGNQNGRDIGIQASGSFLPVNDYNLVDYAFGIFNGSGINRLDLNSHKEFVGRVVMHPIKELSVGGSASKGKYTLTTAPTRRGDRDRIGGEFAYVKDRISLKGEYIWGRDATTKQGWYLQGGYFFIPNKLQGVLKFDTYDTDLKRSKTTTNVYTFGGNWYFNKWAFVQVNYELKDEPGRNLDNNAFTVQATAQF
jgi:phosphate-selective porin